jgi:large subunit ribosomal protein L9
LAVEPTPANMKAIEADKRRAEEERKARRKALEHAAARLKDVDVMISTAANPEGHLYGSVGRREIAAALRDKGHEVEASSIELHESIRQLGNYVVPVVFTEDLRADVKVWVVREGAAGDLEADTREEGPNDAAGTEADEGGSPDSE